ncbi:VWA domain-containing protein [Akkermansiaceae bacterium]|nr:VWA domain-containing protein [Akkermansiaceae bacterium]MDA7888360.1 VWA domain-containing protein [Akkermansiaceae bacterium]MDB4537374.1 VWA domain-containing protein [Akkermansiaceae bacterium]
MTFQFAQPHFLWLLLLLPLAAWLKGKFGRQPAVRFSSTSIARKIGSRSKSRAGALLASLALLALALLIAALARPQFSESSTEAEASGIDILLAIDVSGSMEALDFKLEGQRVNRLAAVKDTVAKFISERPNDRIGLVAFAGRPYLVSPLTHDHEWLLKRLEATRIGQVEDGTAIGSAIASSANHLSESDAKSRISILLTDGMNNAGKAAPLTSAEAAKTLGIKIYTIGAGTRGEAPIPVRDAFGRQRLRTVKVDIDEEVLTDIAEMTGGKYFRATDTDSLAGIYEQIDQLETTTRALKKYEEIDDLFAYAALPGTALMLISFALGQTRFRQLP